MAVINDPSVAANIQRVGEIATGATGAAHVVLKPIPTTLGAYRVSYRFAIVNNQAAASRLFELRNSGSNLIVVTRLSVRWLQTGAHTAAIEDSLDIYKATGFSAVDTANVVTVSGSIKRFGMPAAPGNAVIRGVTAAGAAAGMTGGTLTKNAEPFSGLPHWLLAAVPTAAVTPAIADDMFAQDPATYPFVFAQNEGFVLENRVLLGAAASSSVYLDMAWSEVAAY